MMNDFKKRIRYIFQRPEEEEKRYGCDDIEVRYNTTWGETAIYTRESLEGDQPYTAKIRATNIEDETDVIEYSLQGLPGGRVTFGGYIGEYNKEENKLYSFRDVCYKLFGESLSKSSKKFTKKELIEMLPNIKKTMGQAKFWRMYEIKYKDEFKGKKEFDGSKYFADYIDENDEEKFEQIGKQENSNQIVGKELNSIIIKVGEKEIDTEHFVMGEIIYANNSDFEIKILCNPGRSRIYDPVKFTPNALKKIIAEHEKAERNEEGR